MDENFSVIYGRNPVREILKNKVKGTLHIQQGANDFQIKDIIDSAEAQNIAVVYVDKIMFDKFYGSKKSQGVALKLDGSENPAYLKTEEDFDAEISESGYSDPIVILDGVKDVGNLGAIIRTSLLFGVGYIILPKNNSAPINDLVVKRSAGAVFQMKIVYVTNISTTIEKLKKNGYWIYAASREGTDLSKMKFDGKSAFVFGEEGSGIRPLVKKNCDQIIKIQTNDKLDSLNLSVSVGVVLYEATRT